MPTRARPCSTPGCGGIAATAGRCTSCAGKAQHQRGSAAAQGYGRGHRGFRRAVLERDPVCRWPDGCSAPSTDADHWPLSRRTLLQRRLDPDDPQYGRGLCHSHHSMHTARAQPSSWGRQ